SAVSIGSRAFDLLELLVARPGRLVSKSEIIDTVWGGSAVEEANLTVQISALRRILDQGHRQNSCIQTVPGRGYRFFVSFMRAEPVSSPPFMPGNYCRHCKFSSRTNNRQKPRPPASARGRRLGSASRHVRGCWIKDFLTRRVSDDC